MKLRDLKNFIKNLKRCNGYVLDVVSVVGGKMIYYRKAGSLVTDIKTKVFYS